jgi:hypothetical protein
MTDLLQLQNLKTHLLANPELLSSTQANEYLVKRMRMRTPQGAAEFLQFNSSGQEGRDLYQRRVRVLLAEMGIYKEMFPNQFAASQAPAFSTKREHELYRLLNQKAFPVDVSQIEKDLDFFWPLIPLQNLQPHDWKLGCCAFDDLELVYRLALILSGRTEPNKWKSLGLRQRPAPPLGSIGWTIFIYACSVEQSPLRHLPIAFDLTCYRTQNAWLDCPTDRVTGVEWNSENVAKLFLARIQARQISVYMHELETWLNASAINVMRAVKLWNDSATENWE